MSKIKNIAIYNSAACNLKCKYCFISKNPGLVEADKLIEESFKSPQYYFDMMDNIGIDYNKIEKLDLWGSEPLLYIDRIFNFLEILISKSKSFKTLAFSSNCSHGKTIPAIESIMKFLEKYPYRNFNVRFQISIDGPPELTDLNRGEGVCEKILNNFNDLVNNNFFKPHNVNLSINLKPTIDKSNFSLFLDRDFIIKYYQFFENNFYDPLRKTNKDIANLSPCSIPNIAIPAEFSREDGLTLAKILKLLRSVERENLTSNEKIFKYYKIITWYTRNQTCPNCNDSWNFQGGFCGGGQTNVGLLPNDYYCLCHREFARFCLTYLDNYEKGFEKNNSSIVYNYNQHTPLLIQGADNYLNFTEKVLNSYYNYFSSSIITNNVILIKSLADSGQILPKYSDINEARKTWFEYLSCYSLCMDENIIVNGDFSLQDPNFLRLLFNGAWDVVRQGWAKNERK